MVQQWKVLSEFCPGLSSTARLGPRGVNSKLPKGDHTETQLPYVTPSNSGKTAYYDTFSLTIETPHHQHRRRDPYSVFGLSQLCRIMKTSDYEDWIVVLAAGRVVKKQQIWLSQDLTSVRFRNSFKLRQHLRDLSIQSNMSTIKADIKTIGDIKKTLPKPIHFTIPDHPIMKTFQALCIALLMTVFCSFFIYWAIWKFPAFARIGREKIWNTIICKGCYKSKSRQTVKTRTPDGGRSTGRKAIAYYPPKGGPARKVDTECDLCESFK